MFPAPASPRPNALKLATHMSPRNSSLAKVLALVVAVFASGVAAAPKARAEHVTQYLYCRCESSEHYAKQMSQDGTDVSDPMAATYGAAPSGSYVLLGSFYVRGTSHRQDHVLRHLTPKSAAQIRSVYGRRHSAAPRTENPNASTAAKVFDVCQWSVHRLVSEHICASALKPKTNP